MINLANAIYLEASYQQRNAARIFATGKPYAASDRRRFVNFPYVKAMIATR